MTRLPFGSYSFPVSQPDGRPILVDFSIPRLIGHEAKLSGYEYFIQRRCFSVGASAFLDWLN